MKRKQGDGQVIADHYNARPNTTHAEREASAIIHVKKINNWMKSVLIQLYAHQGDAVLDLACGKGGDLLKWDKAKIGYYVGIDVAEGSIENCRTRYNGDQRTRYYGDQRSRYCGDQRRKNKFTFPAWLFCGDCFEARLDQVLADDSPFDICSCQFAMHYSWSTEARARRALANVSALLRPGGIFIGTMPDANVITKKLRDAQGLTFGNSVFSIRFDEDYSESSGPFGIKYDFHLEDAVDCPEWLVPFDVFRSLAEEFELELVFAKNNDAFFDEHMNNRAFSDLMLRLGGPVDRDQIPPDESEVASLYLAYVFRKKGQSGQTRVAAGRRYKGKMTVEKEDITYF